LKYQQLIYDNLVTKDKKLVVFEWKKHNFEDESLEKMKIEFDKFLKEYF
jgi:esterase/lipase